MDSGVVGRGESVLRGVVNESLVTVPYSLLTPGRPVIRTEQALQLMITKECSFVTAIAPHA